MILCYEAGYDGFWLARLLEQRGIECRVMDPASLQVGSLRSPFIDRIMPLHEAAEAHRLVEARVPVGKLLLVPIQSAEQPTEN